MQMRSRSIDFIVLMLVCGREMNIFPTCNDFYNKKTHILELKERMSALMASWLKLRYNENFIPPHSCIVLRIDQQ